MIMSYVSPTIQPKFDELSASLKEQILARDVQINTIHDLIRVLEEIVEEGWLNKNRDAAKLLNDDAIPVFFLQGLHLAADATYWASPVESHGMVFPTMPSVENAAFLLIYGRFPLAKLFQRIINISIYILS